MNANDELERRIADFYATEAPTRAPDRVLASALATIDTTRQRRALIRMPRRFSTMHTDAKFAIAAVTVIAVAGFGLAVLRPGTDSGVGAPGPTPSPSPSTSPTVVASPDALYPPLTGSLTSDMFGISLAYPAGWAATPAQVPWDSNIVSDCEPACIDEMAGSGDNNPYLRVVSEPLAGATGDEWMTEILSDPYWGDTCPLTTEPITIDGVAGRIALHCPEVVQNALVSAGGRGYLIIHYGAADVAWFKRVLATVQLNPEDAVDAGASVPPSNPPSTSP
jgi:hypothetical protein